MKTKTISQLVRPNILALKPYSCARDEFKGEASVYLDANENPLNEPCNRYPDPLQWKLKAELGKAKGVPPENIFLGNGSDEAIDLLYRCFTRPEKDNVVAIEPTYGMYKVCADINDVEYRTVTLDEHFDISAGRLLAACDDNTKIIWICSPNNPTGNNIDRAQIISVIEQFEGIVVVDEAYSDFSAAEPLRKELPRYPNLVVLNTFSKAWGCAGIRLGMAYASTEIIGIFNKVKYPYNVNSLTQEKALQMLAEPEKIAGWVKMILEQREVLRTELLKLPHVEHIYPTDANFLLVKVDDADGMYKALVDKGIIVRNRNGVKLCGNCLRITVGTPDENKTLLAEMQKLS